MEQEPRRVPPSTKRVIKIYTYRATLLLFFVIGNTLLYSQENATQPTPALTHEIEVLKNANEKHSKDFIYRYLPSYLKPVVPFSENFQRLENQNVPNCFWFALAWNDPSYLKAQKGISSKEMAKALEANFLEVPAAQRKLGDLAVFYVSLKTWTMNDNFSNPQVEPRISENILYHAAIYLEDDLIFQKKNSKDLSYVLSLTEEYKDFLKSTTSMNPRSERVIDTPQIKYFRRK